MGLRRAGHRGGALAITLGALLLAAGPARAATTAKVAGHDIVIDGDAGASDLRVAQANGAFLVEDHNAREAARAGCTEVGSAIRCPTSAITRLVITLGLGDDRTLIEPSVTVRAVIDGEGGKDRIAGGVGNDTISGGLGDDLIEGGIGKDQLRGDGGDNVLDGGDGDDQLFGGTLGGHSTLHGDEGDDRYVDSNGGGDTFFGGAGPRDVADYSLATHSVAVSLGSPGGAPNDEESGGKPDDIRDAEVVIGGSAVDFLTGDDQADELDGHGGADVMSGLGGDDRLVGGPGSDALLGGPGNDTASYADHSASVNARITGDRVSGNGVDGPPGTRDGMSAIEGIEGSLGDDILIGDDGPNRLEGGSGVDNLQGRGGADRLNGGAREGDTLDGGTQGDTFENGIVTYATRTQPVTVLIGSGDKDGNEATDANSDGSLDTVGVSVEGVIGTSFDDTIDGGADPGGGEHRLRAGGPAPLRIEGRAGSDHLDGGDGDDTILPGSGRDVIGGGPGRDTADYSDHAGLVTISLDGLADDGDDLDGNDESSSGEEGDLIRDTIENLQGGDGPDKIRGDAGDNRLDGGRGADEIRGKGGADAIDGGADADTLLGQDGDDFIGSVDGEADVVNCGDGTDEAAVDLADGAVDAVPPVNFSGCEGFRQAPVGEFPVVRIAARAHVAERLLRVRLRCPRALRRACDGRLTAARARGRHRSLGHRRYRIRPGHARSVFVPLSRRGAAHLRHTRQVRLLAAEHDRHGEPKLALRPARVVARHPRRRHH